MNTLRFFGMIVVSLVLSGVACKAQKTDVTVTVKDIKEVKGKIMIAIGDISNPEKMIHDMIDVEEPGEVSCLLKDVPFGKTNVYVFQDLNGNYNLDKNEKGIPIEPCFTKEKVMIKEGMKPVKAKLVNLENLYEKNF